MSPETGQLLILGAVGASALANAATAYVLWREGRGSEVRIVSSAFAPNASVDDRATSGRSVDVGVPAPIEAPVFGRRRSNRNVGPGFHPERQGHPLEVVHGNHRSTLGEAPSLHPNFGQRDWDVAGVDDLHAGGPDVEPRHVQGHVLHTQANAIPSHRPVGVEDAQRGADDCDSEGDPLDPIHAAEHSAVDAMRAAGAILVNDFNYDEISRRLLQARGAVASLLKADAAYDSALDLYTLATRFSSESGSVAAYKLLEAADRARASALLRCSHIDAEPKA